MSYIDIKWPNRRTLLTASSAQRFYFGQLNSKQKQLLEKLGNKKLIFSPQLINMLRFGTKIGAWSKVQLLTGLSNAGLKSVSNANGSQLIWFSDKISRNLIQMTKVANVAPDKFFEKEIVAYEAALLDLANSYQPAYEAIFDWISVLVKFRSTKGKFGLMSHPLAPHVTLVDQYGMRGVPPSSMKLTDAMYCIQENLYHESLHHRYHAFLDASPGLYEKVLTLDQYCSIYVPWHKKRWPLHRAIAAFDVYARVAPMRFYHSKLRRYSPDTRYHLKKAAEKADFAASHLGSELANLASALPGQVKELIYSLSNEH